MADKPIPPDSDDQDSWENLAKDLFGVEFDSPPLSSDDLDDDLFGDDFLSEEDESSNEAEPVGDLEEEPATLSFEEADEPPQQGQTAHEVDLDVLLDFSQPFDEDETAAPALAEVSDSGGEPSLFAKLAAESEGLEDIVPPSLEDDDEDQDFDESEEEDDDFEDDEDVDVVNEDEQLETDDFWDSLEKFAPEELGTPHVDRGQTRAGKPPRDPEIGLVSGSPENELKGNSTFETEFAADADFGLGILKDVETDEDDDSDDSESADSGSDSEKPKPKRRRRRRRRGGRRKKPAADTAGETEGDGEEETRDKNIESRSATEDAESVDDDDLSDDLSQEETGDNDDEASSSAGSSRYKNVPTWSEAIDLIADRNAKSRSGSRTRGGSRPDAKNRKRGGRRRRSPPKSSS